MSKLDTGMVELAHKVYGPEQSNFEKLYLLVAGKVCHEQFKVKML